MDTSFKSYLITAYYYVLINLLYEHSVLRSWEINTAVTNYKTKKLLFTTVFTWKQCSESPHCLKNWLASHGPPLFWLRNADFVIFKQFLGILPKLPPFPPAGILSKLPPPPSRTSQPHLGNPGVIAIFSSFIVALNNVTINHYYNENTENGE